MADGVTYDDATVASPPDATKWATVELANSDGHALRVVDGGANTSTTTSVNDDVTAQTILAANPDRIGATIWNDSTAIAYVSYGAIGTEILTIITDDFNRANGGLGANWNTPGTYSAPLIDGNNVDGSTASVIYLANYIGTTFGPDQYGQVDVTAVAGARGGCHVRDDGNGLYDYFCEWSGDASGTYAISKLVNGSGSVLTSTTGVGFTGTRELKLKVVGRVLTMYVNGAQVLTHTDNTSPILSGRPGIWSFTTTSGVIFDDFEASTIHPAFHVAMQPGSMLEVPFMYRGRIDAFWATNAAGAMRVAEMT